MMDPSNPCPVRLTICGDTGKFEGILIEPARVPLMVGRKVTLRVHELPAVRFKGQVEVNE